MRRFFYLDARPSRAERVDFRRLHDTGSATPMSIGRRDIIGYTFPVASIPWCNVSDVLRRGAIGLREPSPAIA